MNINVRQIDIREAKRKAMRWLDKWQLVVATALIAVASFASGAALNHVGEIRERQEIRANNRRILEAKDARIEELAREAGAATGRAKVAAEKAAQATDTAKAAADKASDAAEKAAVAADVVIRR